VTPHSRSPTPSAADLIERLAKLSEAGGVRDSVSLVRFAETVRELRTLPGASGMFRAKVSSAGGWAALLFSSWRHRRYDWPSRSGAMRIRDFIAEDLAAARRLAPAAN